MGRKDRDGDTDEEAYGTPAYSALEGAGFGFTSTLYGKSAEHEERERASELHTKSLLLPCSLHSCFELREDSESDGLRSFVLTLSYMNAGTVEHRRHTWTMHPDDMHGEARRYREEHERAQFEHEIVQWLKGDRMRLVQGDPFPMLAPIEDGA